jgi:hypothetical protein
VTIEDSSSTGSAQLEGTSVTPFDGVDFINVDSGDTLILEGVDVTGAFGAPYAAINDNGDFQLNDSAVTGNAGYGIEVQGSATTEIVASTIAANSGTGVVLGTGATGTLVNSTVAHNVGGVDNANGSLYTGNSIISNNDSGVLQDCTGPVASDDDSLDDDGSCVVTYSDVNPHLGALTNGGFATPAYPLTPASGVAIGGGDASASIPNGIASGVTPAPATDQHGRTYESPQDLGALAYNAQSITVTSATPTHATVGGPTYTPTATASSGLPVAITVDATSTGCSLSGGVVSFTTAGTCVLDFNQPGNGTYAAAAPVQQSFAVTSLTAQSITITSTAPTGVTVGSPSYTPTATASSGLAVAITLDSTSTGCSLSGGVVSFTAAGTCVIDFNQGGNGTYAAAAPMQQSIPVGLNAQSISVTSTAPAHAQVGGSYAPTATASSGLAVAVTLDSTSSGCSLSGGVVSFTAVGTCVIDFSQGGNTTYAAAPGAQQSLVVTTAQNEVYDVGNTAQLVAAVTSINAEAPGTSDTIVLAPGGVYAPTAPLDFGGVAAGNPATHTGTVTIEDSSTTGQAKLAGSSVQPYTSDFIDVDAGVSVVFQGVVITASAPNQAAINDAGDVQLIDSALTGNFGFGLLVDQGGTAEIVASTIGANLGTGIIDDGTATLVNSTVAFNVGGVDDATGTFYTGNSIISNNDSGVLKDCNAPVTHDDDSLDNDGTCGVQYSDVNPHLGAITTGGFSTPAYPLTAASGAAIGGGDATASVPNGIASGTTVAPATDQYGRTYELPRDLGALAYNSQSITITSAAPTGVTIGSPTYTPAATASSGLAVAITLDSSSTGCTLSGGVVSFTATGTCVIDFNQAGNGTYAAAPPKQQSIAVGLEAQTITITSTAPTGVVVGSASYTPVATASSGLAVAIALDSTSTGCSLSGGVVSFPHAGTCVIDFSQAGNGTYAAAPPKQQSIVIGKAAQTITVTSIAPSSTTVGGPTYTPAATASSGLAVAITLDFSSTGCTLASGVVSFTAAGTCVIDFNQGGNGDYNAAAPKQQSIAVGLEAQSITITSTAPTGATVGGASYTPTATASSGLAVAIALDSTSTGCSLSGGVVSFPHAGTCVIDFSQAGNGTYAAAPPKQQSIVIGKAAQTITVTSTAPSSTTVGGPSYTPAATASSGLAVAITLDSSSTGCTLAGGVVSFTAAGTCVIDFNQGGNGDYNAAPEQQQSITVALNSQTITITSTAPTGVVVGSASYTPVATASSGLAVAIALDSTSTGCSLSGGVVSFPHAGTCVIDFSQAGNGTYAAAPPKQQSIVIGKAAQTITVTSTAPISTTVGGPTYTPAATASSGLAVAITLDSSSTGCTLAGGVVSFTAAGTCVIDFNQGGNGDYNAAGEKQQSIMVTAATKTPQTITITSTAPTGATVGGPTYTPTATASSGLAVAITLDSTSTGCTLAGGVVSFTAVGTCVIDFNQGGNGTYAAAPPKQQSITVGKGSQTITFTTTAPTSATIGTTYTPAASASSGLAVTITVDSSSSSVCSITSGVVKFNAAGSCTIDANQGGNANYNAAPQAQQKVTVTSAKQNQTITFTSSAPSAATVGGATYTPTAKATSGLTVTITSATTSVCTISSGVVTFVAVGNCTLDANQTGNSTYNAAPQVTQSFAVGKGSQTITFTSTAPSTGVVGAAYTVTAAGGKSGNAVTFTIDSSTTPSGACTISGSVVTFKAVGKCVIDANQAGNGNYNAAPQVQQTVYIGEIDDTNSAIQYWGSWTHFSDPGCSGPNSNFDCTESWSPFIGNYVKYTFYGTGIQWIAETSTNGGYATVLIDNQVKTTTASLYSSTSKYQQVVWSDSGLPLGNHTIEIVVDGIPPLHSFGTYVALDAFIVSH